MEKKDLDKIRATQVTINDVDPAALRGVEVEDIVFGVQDETAMTDARRRAIIEAVLFTMGDSMEIQRLSALLETDKRRIREILDDMQQDYLRPESGIMLLFLEDSVQLCTKGNLFDYLVKVVGTAKKPTLSDSILETLSIVAYKQPVTKMDIERIRGVNSSYQISKLVEYDLVKEVGRKDAPGKPLLFGTTEQFLRSFGVSSVGDLPQVSVVQFEEFKLQAEEEAIASLEEGRGDEESGDGEINVVV